LEKVSDLLQPQPHPSLDRTQRQVELLGYLDVV
jgi:hypothetical protein